MKPQMQNLEWDLDLVRLFVRRGKIKLRPARTEAEIDNDLRRMGAFRKKQINRKEK